MSDDQKLFEDRSTRVLAIDSTRSDPFKDQVLLLFNHPLKESGRRAAIMSYSETGVPGSW